MPIDADDLSDLPELADAFAALVRTVRAGRDVNSTRGRRLSRGERRAVLHAAGEVLAEALDALAD